MHALTIHTLIAMRFFWRMLGAIERISIRADHNADISRECNVGGVPSHLEMMILLQLVLVRSLPFCQSCHVCLHVLSCLGNATYHKASEMQKPICKTCESQHEGKAEQQHIRIPHTTCMCRQNHDKLCALLYTAAEAYHIMAPYGVDAARTSGNKA